MVNSPRSAAAVAAIWLVAVVGVSATAWVAIDRAGRDITAGVVSGLPVAPLKTPGLGSQPSPVPAPTATPAPAPATVAPPPTSSAPSRTPRATPSATPAPANRHRRPATRRTKAPPAPTPRDRTITVTGGLVSVRCTGSAIGLRIAQPDNDWRVRVETYGTTQIHVSFTSGGEESVLRTEVSAGCADGTPSFKVYSGSNGPSD